MAFQKKEAYRAAPRDTVTFAQTVGEESMTPPETRYAKSGELRIAFHQLAGSPGSRSSEVMV